MEATQSQSFSPAEAAGIASFFSRYSAAEAESLLWLWLKMTVKGNWETVSAEGYENFARFFDALVALIRTAEVLQPGRHQQEGKP